MAETANTSKAVERYLRLEDCLHRTVDQICDAYGLGGLLVSDELHDEVVLAGERAIADGCSDDAVIAAMTILLNR
jgi:bifunctional pyridoxal-dependent enzyme with beta-cystathionase and maltose regulon repressor activities